MSRCVRGFSLVEVVLALGVIGFALLAIIGLLPIGLQSGRASIQETRANHLAEQIFSTLRSQSFTAVDLSQLGGNSTVNLSTENTERGATGPQLHATYDGNFVGAPDYFTIELRFRNAPDGLVPSTANEVHLRIVSRETGTQPMNYATIIAAQ
jgi:type II secretory pathway pseudopilin PulG